MDPETLQARVSGKVTAADDSIYESLRCQLIWNELKPARFPKLIVQVANEQDVVEAIRFARANGMKVAIRGGGHSWVGFSLRDESLLIDLGRLDEILVDAAAHRATVGPAVTGRDLIRQLGAQGLGFPVGHCPGVRLSGFLLNGGLGFNFNAWGPGCPSIEGAKVVTADGDLITVDQQHEPDLFWAVRGGGPGFFGVITQYQLRLYLMPRAITTTNLYFPLELSGQVGEWAQQTARKLPKEVELTVFHMGGPPSLAEDVKSDNGYACVVSASAFVDSVGEAASALGLVNGCPFASHALHRELNLPTPVDALLDMGAALWPEQHRYLADTIWSNSAPSEVLATLSEHFRRAPSSKSLAPLVFSTGTARIPLPDVAYSMTADALLLCYAIWERSEDDAAHAAWHRETIAAVDRFAIGHYVGESDIVANPIRAKRSYSRSAWQRLSSLRKKYDPDNLFHGHFTAPAK